MRLYLDTADPAEVRRLAAWGAFAGVTTNPVLLARAGLAAEEAVDRLGEAQPGDVFVQVGGATADEMEARVRALSARLPSRLMFKIPPTPVGLAVTSRLRDERLWTAVTALFTLGQGLVAAGAGADVLIPFYDRIRGGGGDPDAVVRDLVELSARRGGRPRVLVASLKSADQVLAAARAGAWGATLPVELAEALLRDAGTDAALARFAEAEAASEE